MRFSWLASLLILLSGSSLAGEAKIPVGKLARVANTYATSIGCVLAFDKRNIVEYPVSSGGEKNYVALVGIDPQCSKGSAMYHSAIVALVAIEGSGVFVVPDQSFPIAENEGLPQYVERIYTKGGELWFSGKEFDSSKDALCCPSLSVTGKVVLRNGNWVTSHADSEPAP